MNTTKVMAQMQEIQIMQEFAQKANFSTMKIQIKSTVLNETLSLPFDLQDKVIETIKLHIEQLKKEVADEFKKEKAIKAGPLNSTEKTISKSV